MLENFSREVLTSLLPRGLFWEPELNSDYDKLLDGISENSGAVHEFLKGIGNIRNPLLTPVLSDLEKEYGVIPATGATEAERRQRLQAFKYKSAQVGSAQELQARLRAAGFDNVYVHENSPAVDPALFLAQSFNMTCGDLLPGGNDAQCGEPEAICASVGGSLLVTGDIYFNIPNYLYYCDDGVYCGDGATAGEFDGYIRKLIEDNFQVPSESGYWPLIFFVGGEATRDPVTGALTSINTYTVPQQRRSEFQRIILRRKPMHTWASLIVVYS